MHFVKINVLNLNLNFPEMCLFVSNWELVNISSYNGLAPNSRQAFIWASCEPGNLYIQCGVVITGSIFSQIFIKDTPPHSSPVRARYGSFVDPASDWYSVFISTTIYVIPYSIGLCYNGILLYMHSNTSLSSINSTKKMVFLDKLKLDKTAISWNSPQYWSPWRPPFLMLHGAATPLHFQYEVKQQIMTKHSFR